MQGFILNQKFEFTSLIDFFESFLWIDRYDVCGDFEIYALFSENILLNVKRGDYIRINESEHLMIVEDLEVNTDYEEGNKIIITGRSLESIIGRRIIWQQTVLTDNFQDAIEKLLNENIISPTDTKRKIDNFIFQKSTDPAITELTINAQFTGTNLYDAICALCISYGLGFKITLNANNQFVFQLYSGKDHSFEQTTNPYVIFTPSFDNIVDSSFYESDRSLKTVTLVAGEGEGLERRTYSAYSNEKALNLERRELYTDARDIRSEVYEEDSEGPKQLTEEEYNKLLESRGLEDLAQNVLITTFDGQVEEGLTFKYGKDFFMGDIIQVVNEFGMNSRARVMELIRSEDTSGSKLYPTFGAVTKKEE